MDAGAVRTVSTDATDVEALARLSDGADAIFMCAMAAYHRWQTDFFPILDGTHNLEQTRPIGVTWEANRLPTAAQHHFPDLVSSNGARDMVILLMT